MFYVIFSVMGFRLTTRIRHFWPEMFGVAIDGNSLIQSNEDPAENRIFRLMFLFCTCTLSFLFDCCLFESSQK